MSDLFDVLADPTRRDILQLLHSRQDRAVSGSDPDAQPGEWSVGELVDTLGTTQPTVSKHLKVLRDAALVSVREVGQRRFYRLESAPLRDIARWLDSLHNIPHHGPIPAGVRPWVDLAPLGHRLGQIAVQGARFVAPLFRRWSPSLYSVRR